jgi:hypothetical protein
MKFIEQNIDGSIYFLLQWAAKYAATGADVFADMGSLAYYQVALVNLLGAVAVAAESATCLGEAVDDASVNSSTAALAHAITDAVHRISERLPGGDVSFLESHRKLDAQGRPDAYWSFYIAPFLASLMRNVTRFERYPQLVEIVMSPDPSKATFESAIPALAEEAASLISENALLSYLNSRKKQDIQEKPPRMKLGIPQYAAALQKKIADLAIVGQRVKTLIPVVKNK